MTNQDAREVARTTQLLTNAEKYQDTVGRCIVDDALSLHRIAGSLHRYDERGCSEDLGCRRCDGDGYTTDAASEDVKYHPAVTRKPCRACGGTGSTVGKRVANLEAKAQGIASAYGFRAYFQGDCRGCPLYLIPETYPAGEDACSYNSRGVAVVWLG